jgi:MoxR-like ATPase
MMPEFADTTQMRGFAGNVLDKFGTTMFGLDEVARLCVVALFTGGHVLLEGNPGFGKTELVKTLAGNLSLEWKRIQFTPDLMPADITGTVMPDFEGGDSRAFKFRRGPIFTSLLLADEINRATPKTQAAMLEAMAERAVTVLGETHALPKPFMVLATQNPIDHEGTYSLPEAQLDRFMFKIHMPAMETRTVRAILQKTAGAFSGNGSIAVPPEAVRQEQLQRRWEEIAAAIRKVNTSENLVTHVTNIVFASNGDHAKLESVSSKRADMACDLAKQTIRFGGGPRAATALLLGAKGWFLLFNDDPGVHSAAGHHLAPILVPTVRHRFKLQFDWQEKFQQWLETHRQRRDVRVSEAALHDELLAQLCLLTAPEEGGYNRTFEPLLRSRAARGSLA